ncbi:MAG: acido-empty-quinoprotein group A [Vicinamibacterales bacterium]
MSIRALLTTGCLLAASAMLTAQQALDPALLGKPPVDAWPTYHGDYSGQHYSTLTQINQQNVRNLALQWSYRANTNPQGAQSGGAVSEAIPIRLGAGALLGGLVRATPIMANGVLYLTSPDNVWALDARTGREIWHFLWRTSGGDHIGNRGVGVFKDSVYVETPDGYVVSIDAKTGKERWHKQIVDVRSQYFTTVAPVIIKNHVILGMGGDALDVPGWLESRDPETGEVQWKWYTTPRAGEPGIETWPSAYAAEHGGGMPWQPVTYDPVLDMVYVTTGNPNPVTRGEDRVGANLYTCSIVALALETGKMQWYHQVSPHDTHDWDCTQVPVLFDTTINGQPRKLLMHAARNGIFTVVDRTNGQSILSRPFVESANWFKGFDEKGQPIPNPDKEGVLGGALVSPNNGGAQNWAPPAYDPTTGTLFMNASQGYEIFYKWGDWTGYNTMGHQTVAVGGTDVSLRAIDVKTGQVKWKHKYDGSEWAPSRPEFLGGLLMTAGRVLFVGAQPGYFVARNPDNGKALWYFTLPTQTSNAPITYMLDGRQYVLAAAGDTLYAFALPR